MIKLYFKCSAILVFFVVFTTNALAQCTQSITYPSAQTNAVTHISNSKYTLGNSRLAVSYAFASATTYAYSNTISSDHQTALGIYTSHTVVGGIVPADRLIQYLSFSEPVYGLNFDINDLDNGDAVVIQAFDQNNTIINFDASNYTLYPSTIISYNAGNKEFTTLGSAAIDANDNRARISVRFNNSLVSRVEINYWDIDTGGSYTVANMASSQLCANPNAFSGNKSTGFTTASVLANDYHLAAAATTSNVTVSTTSSWPSGISLNANGTITVLNTAAAGTHVLNYRICSNATPANCAISTVTLTINADSEGDGVTDAVDLDDDNDGILDAIESPNCFYNSDDAHSIINVNSAFSGNTGDPVSGNNITTLHNLNMADGTLAFNFVGQTITSGSPIFTIEYPTRVLLTSLSVTQTADGMAPASRFGRLFGSNDGTTYAGISAAAGVALNAATVTIPVTSATPYRYYQIRYTGTTSGGNATAGTLGTADIQEISAVYNTAVYIPSASPKPGVCISDADSDGIPNHLDNDSDGDGCADVIEGGANFAIGASYITANRLNTTVNTSGVPAVPASTTGYTQTAGQIIAQAQDNQKSDCLDVDVDGVPNWQDLDNDNDGILDIDEGFCESQGSYRMDTPATLASANGSFNANGSTFNLIYALNTGTAAHNLGTTFSIPYTYSGFTNLATTESHTWEGINVAFTAALQIRVLTSALYANLPANNLGNENVAAATPAGSSDAAVRYLLRNGLIDRLGVYSSSVGNIPTPGALSSFRSHTGLSHRSLFTVVVAPPNLHNGFYAKGQLLDDVTASGGNTASYASSYGRTLGWDYTAFNNGTSLLATNQGQYGLIEINRNSIVFCNHRDTDGDGTPDYLDLDSDGDGCADVIEGGANFTAGASYITGNRLNTAVDANGVPGVPAATTGYTQAAGQTVSQSQDFDKNDCLDSDSDSIPNWRDFDDDNDGILDAVESPNCFYTSAEAHAVINVTSLFDGNTGDPVAGINITTLHNLNTTDGTLAFNFAGQTITSGTAVFTIAYPTSVLLTSLNVTQTASGMAGANAFGRLFGSNDGVAYTAISATPGVALNATTVSIAVTSATPYRYYQIRYVGSVAAGDAVSGILGTADIQEIGAVYNTAVYVPSANQKPGVCISDADSDGIPNHLDNDSDGDGCADVIEGGANFAIGASYITANRLNTTVNANGVPAVPASTTGYTQAAGQTLAQAQDNQKNDCLDVDVDGVPNWVDLDNDNDGILDTNEGRCISSSIYTMNMTASLASANATFNANGATFNLVYDLSSGTAVAGIGTTFNVPFTYSDFLNTASAVDHTWEGFNTSGLGIRHVTAQLYTGLPANNSTTESYNASQSADWNFRNWLNTGALTKLGTFTTTIGNIPTPSNILSSYSTNTGLGLGSVFNMIVGTNAPGGYYAKMQVQNTIETGGANTVTYNASYGQTYAWDYTAFNNNPSANIPTNGGNRGLINIYQNTITFCNHRDTDGDGTPDYLDLDSDGDGCADVIEGGANFTAGASYITGNRLNTAVNASGVPAVPASTSGYTQAAGQTVALSLENDKNDCLDNDSDGVSNWKDLDDDNDGVFDAIESPNCFYSSDDAHSIINVTSLFDGNTDDPVAGINITTLHNLNTADAALAFNFAGQTITSDTPIFTFSYPTSVLLTSLNVTQTASGMAGANAFGRLFGSNDGSTYTAISANTGVALNATTVSIAVTSVTPYRYYQIRYVGSVAAGNAVNGTLGTADIQEIGAVYNTAVYVPSANQKLGVCISDADSDGIPNHLDNDSDGDGCADVIEGGSNFAIGASYITANRLNTAVNANGVPGVPASTSGYTLTSGQTLAQAQDNQKIDCLDVDVDGVPNWQDLDNDNDGILDTDEGFCESQGAYQMDMTATLASANGSFNANGSTFNLIYSLISGTAAHNLGTTFSIPYTYSSFTNLATTESHTWEGVNIAFTSTLQIRVLTSALYANLPANNLDNENIAAATPAGSTDGGMRYLLRNGLVDRLGVYSSSIGTIPTPGALSSFRSHTGLNHRSLYTVVVASPNLYNGFYAKGQLLDNVAASGGNTATYASGYGRTLGWDYTAFNNGASLLGTNQGQYGIIEINRNSIIFCNHRDTDGDGTPDYLDLDSDGDGCADVIEGGANFVIGASYITSNRLNTAVDANGVPGVPAATTGYTQAAGQTVGQSLDSDKNDCIDSDIDGVANWQDLDDDNDGILDKTECIGFIANNVTGSWKGKTASNVTVSASNNTTQSNSFVTTADPQVNFSVNQNGGDLRFVNSATAVTFALTFSTPVPANEIGLLIDDVSNTFSPLSTYKIDVDFGAGFVNPSGIFIKSNAGRSVGVGYNATTGVPTFRDLPNPADNSGEDIYLKGSGNTLVKAVRISGTNLSSAGADLVAYSFFALLKCDTDNDGTLDDLDLDSDGDGCFDAFEGDETVLNTQLTAGGRINIATQGGIGTTVDVNHGVPNLVNNGGAADIGSDVGQGIGDSKNALINICCVNLPTAGTPDSYTQTGISDLVGFANGWPQNVPNGFIAIESKNKVLLFPEWILQVLSPVR